MKPHDQHHSVDLDRLASAVLDPIPPHTIPAPTRTAAQLRRLADQRQRPRVQRTGWRVPVIASAVLVMATLVVVVSWLRPASWSIPSNQPAAVVAAPEPLPISGTGRPARGPLKELASVAATAGDTPHAGRYTYVHTQSWYADTTGKGRAATSRDEQLWWKADRTGLQVITTLMEPPPRTSISKAGSTPQRTTYDHNNRLVVNIAQPSTEPALLAAQLNDVEPVTNGPQSVVRGVVDLYRYHNLTAGQRAAALIALANTDGLTAYDAVVDRLGRPALAISVDSDNGATRDTLLFDQTSGRLLSYERLRLRASAAELTDYTIFVTASNTDTITA
jgi:hypothetical protein